MVEIFTILGVLKKTFVYNTYLKQVKLFLSYSLQNVNIPKTFGIQQLLKYPIIAIVNTPLFNFNTIKLLNFIFIICINTICTNQL